MVAGETSGDLLASRLLSGLRPKLPQSYIHGIGGPKMAEYGFVSDWPMDKLAVRGLFEVLAHYREIKGIQNALCDKLLAEQPAVFIGVDAPDFNLGLEKQLKRAVFRPCTSSARQSGPGAADGSKRLPNRYRTCWWYFHLKKQFIGMPVFQPLMSGTLWRK
jgi:hypothetical protein